MQKLLKNIRFYVLVSSIAAIVAIYAWVVLTVPSGSLQVVKLTEAYALLALLYLYLALLPSPLYAAFPKFPYKAQVVRARRAIGVSSFLFGLSHAYLAFFRQLGGFPGLGFLSRNYVIAISLSATALLILATMAATSTDAMMRRLGKRWKRLHQFVYLAGIFIVIHAMLLGSDFADPANSRIAQIAFILLAVLFVLEAVRIDTWLSQRVPRLPKVGLAALVAVSLIGYFPHYLLPADSGGGLLNIHAQHIQIAKDAQQGTVPGQTLPNLTGPAAQALRGDRTKRYTTSFNHPDAVQANTPVPLSFQVFDASSGNQVLLFSKVYSKFIHLIVVDDTLQYFEHLHPEFSDGKFKIDASFPHDGTYHLYVDFQPFGAIEQQQAFTLNVGNAASSSQSVQEPDLRTVKTFGEYEVSLNTSSPLKATELSVGSQTISFTFKDAATGQPVTNLKPYLEAFGHLVLINQQTFEYVHVHPNDLTVPAADANGGPTVTFLPLGLYGPIKPGVYRVFGQFNPNGSLMVADYTISVK